MTKTEKRSTDLSNLIDNHLRELRWMSYGLGAVAAMLIIRNLKASDDDASGSGLRMMKKFVAVNQIPSHFITKNYTLQGHIKHISDGGVLQIEHTPIIEIKWISGTFKGSRANDQSQFLSVLPAGLDLSPDAVLWLKENACGKHAWFQMLARDEDALYCDVRIKKGYLYRTSISNALVEQSLCKVQHFHSPPDGEYFDRYLRKLITLEHRASRRGKGIWKEEESWLKRKSAGFYTSCKEKLKSIINRKRN